jgi:diguanylate cyclase (GGDEF)-like protein
MDRPLRILLVEDSEDDAALLARHLRRGGFEPDVTRVDHAAALEEALERTDWDVIITDHNLPGFGSEAAMAIIRAACLDVPIIIVSGTIGEDAAVAAMKSGASDYIMKDNMTRLVPAIERELREADVRRLHRKAEDTIRHMAFHDALTGLANRHQFEQRLALALDDAKRGQRSHALLYLDLDQFKVVNDTCGHVAGDQLLKQLAQCMGPQIRESDVLARLGGDEFGVLLHHCPLERAQDIAAKLLRAINHCRFSWLDKTFTVGGSIGLVPVDGSYASIEDLLRNADVACYTAKDLGRNRVHVHHPNDTELMRRHGEMQWVSRINQALDQDRFTLYQQKILPLAAASETLCCEVLVRMRDEGGQLIMPGAFLPAAERYNLAPAVDRWVVGHLLRHLESRYAQEPAGQHLFFLNISGATLNDDEFFIFVHDSLKRSAIPPSCLCFEITETAAIANLDRAVRFIQGIRAEGCRFALDDFGAGLSSFTYLKTLPVDFLKIDGGFVRDINHDPMNQAIVEAINRVGHAVGLKTIAEFVEDEAIRQTLLRVGVDYAQGYGLHRPEPVRGGTQGVLTP